MGAILLTAQADAYDPLIDESRVLPGAEVISSNCVACHSAGMVLTQPALSRAAWDAEVHKMIATYKAPISEADAATIIAYLAQLKVEN